MQATMAYFGNLRRIWGLGEATGQLSRQSALGALLNTVGSTLGRGCSASARCSTGWTAPPSSPRWRRARPCPIPTSRSWRPLALRSEGSGAFRTRRAKSSVTWSRWWTRRRRKISESRRAQQQKRLRPRPMLRHRRLPAGGAATNFP